MAIDLSREGMRSNAGGPFGCVIVKNGRIIARGNNRVTSNNDPTAHAEVIAIREACRKLGTFQLDDCIIYSSCEPCPMCLGAIYWARPAKVIYANTKLQAAAIGFDDAFIYEELTLSLADRSIRFEHCPDEDALAVFTEWKSKSDKVQY